MALTNLQVTEIMNSALIAFRVNLIAIRLFSIAMRKSGDPLQKGDTMKVPYYPLEGSASKDFNGTYDFTGAGANASGLDVVVNKRKYQPLITTSVERERYHYDPKKLGEMKGAKLAQDVVVDILSLVTAANYGAAGLDVDAATFDSDDVVDLRTVCGQANWPQMQRGLVLDSAYEGGLLKDGAIKGADAYGSSDPIQEGLLRRLLGFDLAVAEIVPANGENLKGFACYPSAALVGFAPVTPDPAVREKLTAYEVAQDPETGLLLEYRLWGDPDSDSRKEVIEANYGFLKGESTALKRIIDTP